ncbi:hypothetical protein D0466_19020 [Peribacillus glennii]|uniref:Uncharacterized protein n=1 Tax=Peribacillus glennii TaxID=2303991 RepID=A0A372L7R3_9BACI|nr:hypothetical protein D0466_19020 [Peribacillus glennii]
MLRLLLAGYSPAECVKIIGVKWSCYQAIQRKLGRELKKFLYILKRKPFIKERFLLFYGGDVKVALVEQY